MGHDHGEGAAPFASVSQPVSKAAKAQSPACLLPQGFRSPRRGQCPWVWPVLGPTAVITRLSYEGQGREEGAATPVSWGLWGLHVADGLDHAYSGQVGSGPWPHSQERGPGRHPQLLAGRAGGSGQPTSPPEACGVGRVQPHPGQPLHTLSRPGPVAHTRGLPGTLLRCPLGTSVPHTGLPFSWCPG